MAVPSLGINSENIPKLPMQVLSRWDYHLLFLTYSEKERDVANKYSYNSLLLNLPIEIDMIQTLRILISVQHVVEKGLIHSIIYKITTKLCLELCLGPGIYASERT